MQNTRVATHLYFDTICIRPRLVSTQGNFPRRAHRLPYLVPSGPIRVITGPSLAWPIIVGHSGSLLLFTCYVRLLGRLRNTQKEKGEVADLTNRSSILIISNDWRAPRRYHLPKMSCFVSAP